MVIHKEDDAALVETKELFSIPGFRASIGRSLRDLKEGRSYSVDEVFGKKSPTGQGHIMASDGLPVPSYLRNRTGLPSSPTSIQISVVPESPG